ncbi:MAG: hypothetical protein U1E05_10935 [Patescibacteria group bacterium]|nr:hypothetical protein [Patescibacteria group bacterium]
MKRRQIRPKRSGFLLLSALVCVALVIAMGGLMTRMMVVNSQYDRAQLRRMQCQWLVDSGIERAAARLATEAEFTGETWHIEPEQLDGRNGAVVQIAVTPQAEPSAWRTVSVQADYPADSPARVRHSRVVRLPYKTLESPDEEEP